MATVESWVRHHEQQGGDISEHLRTLALYAAKCNHVTEFGVRWVCSTWGLLLGKPKTMLSFDVNNISPEQYNEIQQLASQQGTNWNFQQANVLNLNIQETDLLFIDTLHSYKQLKMELFLHAPKVKKYLVFHDTTTFGYRDENITPVPAEPFAKGFYDALPDKKGLMPAIAEFVKDNPNWVIKRKDDNNNGLTVLGNMNHFEVTHE